MSKKEYDKDFLDLEGKINHLKDRNFSLSEDKEDLEKDEIFLKTESFSNFLSYLILYRKEDNTYETESFKFLREDYEYGARVSELIFPIVINVLEVVQFRAISSISNKFESFEDRHLWYLNTNIIKEKDTHTRVINRIEEINDKQEPGNQLFGFRREIHSNKNGAKNFLSIFDLSNLIGHYIFGELFKSIDEQYKEDFIKNILSCESELFNTLFYHLRSFRNQVVHKNEIILYKIESKEHKNKHLIKEYLNIKEDWNDYSLMIALFVEIGIKLKMNFWKYIHSLMDDLTKKHESGKHDFKRLLSWLEEKTKANENVA